MKDSQTLRKLMEAASTGKNDETSRLLLYLINNPVADDDLRNALGLLQPFSHSWRSSKKYYHARLCLNAGYSEQGMSILCGLSDDAYTPAMTKLGAILFANAKTELEFRRAIGLVDEARKAGHVWAARNYWVMEAKQQVGFRKVLYFAIGFFMLIRIFIIRWWYDPGEPTTY